MLGAPGAGAGWLWLWVLQHRAPMQGCCLQGACWAAWALNLTNGGHSFRLFAPKGSLG